MAHVDLFFNGGTNAAAMTPANTGFTAVDTTSPPTFSNAAAGVKEGALCMSLPATTTNTSSARYQLPATSPNIRFRFYLNKSNAVSGGDLFLYEVRANTGANNADRICRLVHGGADKLVLKDYGSGAGVDVWTATNVLPANEKVRVEGMIEQGTGGNGRVRIAFYHDDAGLIEDSGWITGLNLLGSGGTNPINQVYIGKNSNYAITGTYYIDTFTFDTAADYSAAFIGAYAVKLATPTGLTMTSSTSAVSVTAGWTAVANATNYDVRFETFSGGTWSTFGTYNTTATSKTIGAAEGLPGGVDVRPFVMAKP